MACCKEQETKPDKAAIVPQTMRIDGIAKRIWKVDKHCQNGFLARAHKWQIAFPPPPHQDRRKPSQRKDYALIAPI
jgi:NAD-dependent DNA ligase